MKDHQLVARKSVYNRGAVPRNGRLCDYGCGVDAEEHVQLVAAGRKYDLHLCDQCAKGILVLDPESTLDFEADEADETRRDCEYVPSHMLDRSGRRLVDYRKYALPA